MVILWGHISAKQLFSLLTGQQARWPDIDHFEQDAQVLRALLADLSLDRATFVSRYGKTQAVLIEELCAALPHRSGTARQVTAFILVFAQGIQLSDRASLPDGHMPNGDEIVQLKTLVMEAPTEFSRLIKAVYAIDEKRAPIDERRPPRHLQDLKIAWETLALHKLGTTSLIFTAKPSTAPGNKLVLKVSHVLYSDTGPIGDANEGYAAKWRRVGARCDTIVHVYASGRGWVIEDFIQGQTLREFLAEDDTADATPRPVLRTLDRANLYQAIARAVDSLHHLADGTPGLAHGDLNPENMIVRPRGAGRGETNEYEIKLIDMGRNLLASDIFGRVRSADARYVAPEVRSMDPQETDIAVSADYYSLGHLLANCFGYDKSDGFYFLDERIFTAHPELASTAARLLDDSPDGRDDFVRKLQSFSESRPDKPLTGLTGYVQEQALLISKVENRGYRPGVGEIRLVREARSGGAGGIRSQIALLWDSALSQRTLRDMAGICAVRSLATGFWCLLASLLILVSISLKLPVGVKSLPHYTQLVEFLGSSRHETLDQNAQIWIAGVSCSYVSFQYVVKVFGGISLWRTNADRRLRIASETLLWSMAVVIFPCVALSLYLGNNCWPWFAFTGYLFVTVNNVITQRARRQIDKAIHGSRQAPGGGPDSRIRESWFRQSSIGVERDAEARFKRKTELLDRWITSMLILTVLVGAVAAFVRANLAYAVILMVLNIGILGWGQVARQGGKLKANLSQYQVAGEILGGPVAPARPTRVRPALSRLQRALSTGDS